MTRFSLPDGTEAELTTRPDSTANYAWVEHSTLGPALIERDKLTEIQPPLPPVPECPAVLLGDHVWARDDIRGEGPVFLKPGGPTLNWEELNEYAADLDKPIIALVPDPAVDAPELPWQLKDHAGNPVARVELSCTRPDKLFVDLLYAHLERDQVRELASVMWGWAEARASRDTQEASRG